MLKQTQPQKSTIHGAKSFQAGKVTPTISRLGINIPIEQSQLSYNQDFKVESGYSAIIFLHCLHMH